jgi:hypothetical protein
MMARFLEWRRTSWRRHVCRERRAHALTSAAAALEHLREMEEDLRELRQLCPQTPELQRFLRLTELEISECLRPLDDMAHRVRRIPGLADLEREIERRR